jgi:hypothetical protein
MRAKAVHDQLQLCYPTVPSPLVFHLPSLPLFTNDERALVGAWKRYLKWEVSNPLNLPEKKVALVRRVQNAYRKAVVYMRFYPEIWYVPFLSYYTPRLGDRWEHQVHVLYMACQRWPPYRRLESSGRRRQSQSHKVGVM